MSRQAERGIEQGSGGAVAEQARSGPEISVTSKAVSAHRQQKLMELMNNREFDRFRETYLNWVNFAIIEGNNKRQPQWTESIAVGNKVYVEKMKVL